MGWSSSLAVLRALSLKTKLLLTMLSLLVLAVGSEFLVHLLSERRLLAEVRSYTEKLSTAIEIAQGVPGEELTDPQAAVDAYARKLRALGVKDVSIANAADEVEASTNPNHVGKRLLRQRRGPQLYVVRGVLGDEGGQPGSRHTSTLTVPIVAGDQRVGYVVITRHLDDFASLARRALLDQVGTTFVVFAIGMAVSVGLAWSFARPLRQLGAAARRVAAGDLDPQVPVAEGGELGDLSRSFEEMVERLRDRRALEERLHFAERSTALGRLASALAHEIRNPLNLISLSVDHARDRLAPEETRKRAEFEQLMESVKMELARLNRLVGDFLSFGRPSRLAPRPCDLAEVVRGVGAIIATKARDQGVLVSIDLPAGTADAVADPELLRTALLNLALNALDAMPGGGALSVELETDGSDRFAIEVRDTGTGITPETARSAFDPYFSTKEAGLGLGLALTRQIVEDHGGRVSLATRSGTGTTARVELPRERTDPPTGSLVSEPARVP